MSNETYGKWIIRENRLLHHQPRTRAAESFRSVVVRGERVFDVEVRVGVGGENVSQIMMGIVVENRLKLDGTIGLACRER